jgi:hypothetical protein
MLHREQIFAGLPNLRTPLELEEDAPENLRVLHEAGSGARKSWINNRPSGASQHVYLFVQVEWHLCFRDNRTYSILLALGLESIDLATDEREEWPYILQELAGDAFENQDTLMRPVYLQAQSHWAVKTAILSMNLKTITLRLLTKFDPRSPPIISTLLWLVCNPGNKKLL